MEWKSVLIAAKEMQAKSGLAIYDRTKLLIEVYENEQFRKDCNARNVNAEDELDAICQDTFTGFLNLRTMILHYPNRDQWKRGNLSDMYRQMLKEMDERRRERTQKEHSKRDPYVTRLEKQVKELKGQLHDMKIENRMLKQRLAKVEKLTKV